MTDHKLNQVPKLIYAQQLAAKLRTLDLSGNHLHFLPENFAVFSQLKILNLDRNDLHAGSVGVLSKLPGVQKLSITENKLGLVKKDSKHPKVEKAVDPASILPLQLPTSLKEMNLQSNQLVCIPQSLLMPSLENLEKLVLSNNGLVNVADVWVLSSLVELHLDDNKISKLPEDLGKLKKLKILSLKRNFLTIVDSPPFKPETNPQPVPKSLLVDTALIDFNLQGNKLTNQQMNEHDGFSDFLNRRQKVKTKTLVNMSNVCGLDE